MMEIPSTRWTRAGPARAQSEAPVKTRWRKTDRRVEHTFTHFHLELAIWSARVPAKVAVLGEGLRWARRSDLDGEALPSVMRKIIAAMDMPSLRKPGAAARG
jgi:A/G-specific adenine glycosylase